jgi:hypothetical protein
MLLRGLEHSSHHKVLTVRVQLAEDDILLEGGFWCFSHIFCLLEIPVVPLLHHEL